MAKQLTKVEDGLVVAMTYTLCLDDGEPIDSCDEHEALEFIQGTSGLVEGFTTAIAGLQIGEEKDFTVPPELGYGEYDPEDNVLVPLTAFPDDMNPVLGMELNVQTEDDEVRAATVEEINEDGVLLDFNHVFAGETLHFHVKILRLREPTPEELEHGHVHGDHHHH